MKKIKLNLMKKINLNLKTPMLKVIVIIVNFIDDREKRAYTVLFGHVHEIMVEGSKVVVEDCKAKVDKLPCQ